jgi:hypothetical protein
MNCGDPTAEGCRRRNDYQFTGFHIHSSELSAAAGSGRWSFDEHHSPPPLFKWFPLQITGQAGVAAQQRTNGVGARPAQPAASETRHTSGKGSSCSAKHSSRGVEQRNIRQGNSAGSLLARPHPAARKMDYNRPPRQSEPVALTLPLLFPREQ